MSEYKQKRLITHKYLGEWLDQQGKFDIDVFNLYLVTYYKKGTSPLDTGKVEIVAFLQDTDTVAEAVLEDGREVYDKDKVIITEISFGDWLVKAYENVFGRINVKNREDRERVNEFWWGSSVTKTKKNDIKRRLYGYTNQVGNIVLRQEAQELEEERKNPPATYSDALTHLRDLRGVKVSLEGLGTFRVNYIEDGEQSGYISEYMGNILYDNAKAALGVTINSMTGRDEDKLKKIKYKLL